MRSFALLFALLTVFGALPAQAQVGSCPLLSYCPPSGGSGSWDGGAFTAPALGPTGCAVGSVAYSFTADSGAGLCLNSADSVSVHGATSAGTEAFLTLGSAQGFFHYRDAAMNSTGITLGDNQMQGQWDGGSPSNLAFEPDSTGFAVWTAAKTKPTARTFTNTDGCLTISNGDGVAADPVLNVDGNCVPKYSAGAADPPATCTPPELYYETDTFELSLCSTTDHWEFMITQSAQTDDAVIVGSGTGYALKVLPDCDAANARINYDTTTNAFSCSTTDITLAGIAQASAASVLLGRGSAGGAGDFQEVTLGSGLTMTNQVLSASGSSSFNPETDIDQFEELMQSTHAFAAQPISTGTTAQVDGAANHPGIRRISSHASNDNSGGNLIFGADGTFQMGAGLGGTSWKVSGLIKLNSITNVGAYFGISMGVASLTNGVAGGIWARFDTDDSDTKWVFQICDSATSGCDSAGDDTNSTTELSTVDGSLSWTKVSIRYAASGVGGNPTYYFAVNSETEVTFCSSGCNSTLTNVPGFTGSGLVFGFYTRTTTGVQTADVDWTRIQMTGLSR